jgi:hypothetical protein
MNNGDGNIYVNRNAKICFDGFDLKEIIGSSNILLIARANNDSLFLMNKNDIGLNQLAANEIAIVVSTGFSFRIVTNFFSNERHNY